jgi:hypothetical protein
MDYRGYDLEKKALMVGWQITITKDGTFVRNGSVLETRARLSSKHRKMRLMHGRSKLVAIATSIKNTSHTKLLAFSIGQRAGKSQRPVSLPVRGPVRKSLLHGDDITFLG